MSNLYVLNVDEALINDDIDKPGGVISVFKMASKVIEWSILLWALMDNARSKALEKLVLPALQNRDQGKRQINTLQLQQIVSLLTNIERMAEQNLVDKNWGIKPDAIKKIKLQTPTLMEEFNKANNEKVYYIDNRLSEIVRLRNFFEAVVKYKGIVEFG